MKGETFPGSLGDLGRFPGSVLPSSRRDPASVWLAEPADPSESTLPPEPEPASLQGYFDIKSNYRFI